LVLRNLGKKEEAATLHASVAEDMKARGYSPLVDEINESV
jgi:hypothetical protein